MRFCVDGGNYYTPRFEVIEPSGVVVKSAHEVIYSAAVSNVAGWAGMVLDLIVVPTNVSFSAVSVMEIPETGKVIPPSGYFTNNVFPKIWHHTTDRGAGVWHRVQRDNHFLDDYAECGEGLPGGWSDGTITWRIPVAWGHSLDVEGEYFSKEFGVPHYQLFIIDSSGKFRVQKFNEYWAERDPDGTRRRAPLVN